MGKRRKRIESLKLERKENAKVNRNVTAQTKRKQNKIDSFV